MAETPLSLSPVLANHLAQLSEFSEILEPVSRDLDAVEFFAGTHNLSTSLYNAGMNAMPFDKVISPEQNILTHSGFQLAVQWTLRLREGGLLWAAVECSTWAFLSRSTYSRSKSRPEGDLDHAAVRIANRMAERTVMLCVLAASRGAKIVIENPQSSLLSYLSPMSELCEMVLKEQTCVWLGSFGAPTAKPVLLWSNWPSVEKLRTERPFFGSSMTQLVTKSASGEVTGRRKALKDSHAYPARFGDAVAQLLVVDCLQAASGTDVVGQPRCKQRRSAP